MNNFLTILDREGRFGEWMTSAFLFGLGLTFLLPGNTMRFGEFWFLHNIGMNETLIASLVLVIGTGRMAALWINGSWRRTPALRGMGAIFGAAIFALLFLSSIWPYFTEAVPTPNPIWPFFFTSILADFRGCFRAGADHRCSSLLA